MRCKTRRNKRTDRLAISCIFYKKEVPLKRKMYTMYLLKKQDVIIALFCTILSFCSVLAWCFSCTMLAFAGTSYYQKINQSKIKLLKSGQCTAYFPVQCCVSLGQHCTRFSPMQCCPKRINTTLKRIFSSAMLSWTLRTVLHRHFPVQCCCPRSIRTTLHKICSCTMLSGAFWAQVTSPVTMVSDHWPVIILSPGLYRQCLTRRFSIEKPENLSKTSFHSGRTEQHRISITRANSDTLISFYVQYLKKKLFNLNPT